MPTVRTESAAPPAPEADAPRGKENGGARAPRAARIVDVLALPLIVLASALLAARYSLQVDEWRVMTDEMLYLRMAQSIGETFSPLATVHGVRVDVHSLLYPLLISPFVRLLDLPTAAGLAHGLNALLMASAAIPAYLLARWLAPASRIAPPALAALTAFVPWLTLSFSLMTETVAYPMIVWAVYGIVRAVGEPSPKAEVLALAGIAGAFFARTQFVFLLAVFPAAVVVHELGFRLVQSERGGRLAALCTGIVAALRRHLVLWAVACLGLLLLLTRGVNLYGSYQGVVRQQGLWTPGMGQSLLDHIDEIALGIGILPVPLTVALVAHALFRPRANVRVHAFAVVLLLVLPALAFIAASFVLSYGGGLPQERYIFYIAPFLFAGAVASVVVHRPPLAVAAAAGAVTALAILQTEFNDPVFPPFASPTKFAYPAMQFRADQAAGLLGFERVDLSSVAALLGFAAVLAVALANARRRSTATLAVLACALCGWGIALFVYCAPRVLAEHEAPADGVFGVNRSEEVRTWIDHAAGSSASVGLVPSTINVRDGEPIENGNLDQAVWWDAEFWNKSVDRTFQLRGAQIYTPFPYLLLRIGPDGQLVPSAGALPGWLVLASSEVRFAPVARSRAVSPSGDLTLYQLARPARAAWSTAVGDATGDFSSRAGMELTLHPRRRARARRITVLLDRGPGHPGRYKITGPGVRMTGALGPSGRRGKVTFEACVPARTRWTGRIDLPGTPNARLASVKDVPGGRCGR